MKRDLQEGASLREICKRGAGLREIWKRGADVRETWKRNPVVKKIQRREAVVREICVYLLQEALHSWCWKVDCIQEFEYFKILNYCISPFRIGNWSRFL